MRTLAATVCVLVALSSVCSAQKLWNGTRYGMSAAELQKRFGSRLETAAQASDYGTGPEFHLKEKFCGANFDVALLFIRGELADRLALVLMHGTGAAKAADLRACVVREYTSVYGPPLTRESQDAAIEHAFTRGNTTVFVTITQANDVYISYDVGVVYVEPPYIGASLKPRTRH